VQETLRLDRQADVMLRLDASTAAIAASIASLAASDAPMPAIPPPQPPHFQAVSATLTATPTTTSTTAADAATTEAARNEILALAKSLQPLTFTAATDPVELRAALREHDKGWELDTEWQEVPPRQEEGGLDLQQDCDWPSRARLVPVWPMGGELTGGMQNEEKRGK
jgi:thioesterase domain-containing protein